jgi:TolB-like protein/DNA-binding winged helix-turn-helix (wHTH) protein/Tfp pilus assembly protein PilF
MATHAGSGETGPSRVVRFGVFQLDLRSGELHKRGVRVRLQQQPFRVLELLLERPGEVVLREELRARLWASDTWVDFDHGLNKAVNKLRETLGDSAESPRFIETLAKRGYRFLAPVEPVVVDAEAPIAPAAERPPVPRASGRRTWIAGAIVAAAVIAAAALATWMRFAAPAPAAARTMVAILPFANIEGDPEQDYFCDGMTEEIILQIGRVSPARLGVIARTSSMHYKGTQKRVDEIARELGVQYLLEGTVRRSGNRVRIAARLVQSNDQTPMWAESYERDLADVFDIQSEVARQIATSLAIELLPASNAESSPPSRTSAEVYEAYLKGRYYWNRRAPFDLERAVSLLEDAVARDARYVPASAALADALNVLPWYGLRPPREAYPKSKEAARRALSLDDTSAAAHTALAYAYHYYDWNWADAEREYARALALNPNYAPAHQWRAAHFAELGRIDEALAGIERAQRLDPHSTIVHAAIGWINYLGRRYQPAVDQLQRTLQIDSDFVPARLWLGHTFEAMGRPQEAIDQYLHVRRSAGVAPTGLGELARGYAAIGRIDQARAALTELLATAQRRYVEADLIARAYEGLGEKDNAIEWLEQGHKERAVKMVLIGVDPQFDRLRDDSRFRTLVRKLNLPM